MAGALFDEKELTRITGLSKPPRLLLHCCCAPCTSSVLECLSEYFCVTALFYNPNIAPEHEYIKRSEEFKKLPQFGITPDRIDLMLSEYDPGQFNKAASGLEDEPEGGARCRVCYKLRLEETSKRASEGGFDYFTTTLSVSPHKNAAVINEIGSALTVEDGVKYLRSDFKKRDGYKRSVELSKQYGLYRQSYCGCLSSQSAR